MINGKDENYFTEVPQGKIIMMNAELIFSEYFLVADESNF